MKSKNNGSRYLPSTVCNDGEANITASTVNALCYNGVWYDVVQRTQPTGADPSHSEVMTELTSHATESMEQSAAKGQGSGVLGAALGSLFAITLLGLVAVATVFVLWVVRSNKKIPLTE